MIDRPNQLFNLLEFNIVSDYNCDIGFCDWIFEGFLIIIGFISIYTPNNFTTCV